MKKPVKDMAASVRARLAALAKKEGKTFDSFLLLYFQERLVARLAASRHRESFVLKGALLFFARASAGERLKTRPTKDVDFLARKLTADLDEIAGIFREIVAIKLEDGVAFASETVEAERIKEDADYEGVRVHVEARLGQPKGRLQIDIGFGDVVTPKILKTVYPTLLAENGPELLCYPFETVVAEKLEAAIKLSVLNSRMKDFFDLQHLAHTRAFDGAILQQAIQKTFAHRGTAFRADTPIFSPEFRRDRPRQLMWEGYLRKAKLTGAPASFDVAMERIAAFVGPAHLACCSTERFSGTWFPGELRWRQNRDAHIEGAGA